MPSVSVVIPTHNRCDVLPRAIDSVLQQSRAAEQVIVVDDGSDDATSDCLGQFAGEVEVVRLPLTCGVSAARNRGIIAARGEWIAFLDSDDAWLFNKLERQLGLIADDPSLRLVHSDEIWIRGGRRVNQMKKYAKRGGSIFRHCLPLCAISPSAAMIHRSVFDEVGLFDESLPACEDYDLWLRICARMPVGYIDEPLIVKYGGHDDQLSRRFAGMDRFRVRALMKILDEGVLSDADAAAARRALVEKCRIYSEGARKRGNMFEAERYRRIEHEYGRH